MPHIRATIRKMAQLAKSGSHSYPIRNLATRITRDVPSKFPTAELGALYKWVRDNIRYRYDPLGLEWLQSPQRTVLEGAGDCDDMTILLGALAGALGHPYRFRTVGAAPDVQQHVGVQVFDRKRWINLDPVIEPTQHTTAPRTDPGTFGMFADGSEHLWSSEGTMLSGVASARDRELWSFAPYFAQVPPYGGTQRPRPGVPARPDPRYRSMGAPGPWQMPQREYAIVVRPSTLTAGQLAGIEPYYHPTLGAGKLRKKIKKGLKKAVKKVAKGVKKVGRVVAKIPGLKQIGKAVVGIIPGASTAIQATRAVVKVGKGIKRAVKKGKKAKHVIASVRKAAPKRIAAKARGKVIARVKPKALPRPKRAVAVAKPGRKATPARARPVPMRSTSKSAVIAATTRPTPEAKQYPSNARMLWDRGAGVFRVFIPANAGISGNMAGGLGIIRPAISFALGEVAADVGARARAAIAAVNTFTKNHKAPPAIKLPAVQAFQQAVGNLTPDGLWGSNTRAAAGHYAPGVALPKTAPKFNVAVTWSPPVDVSNVPEAASDDDDDNATPAAIVQPAPGAAPVVVTSEPPPPGATFVAPPGYVEVGQEKNNPGLPPAGYQGPGAPPAPPVPGTPSQPGAPGGASALNPPSSPDWTPAGGGPGPLPVATVSPLPQVVPAPGGGSIVLAPGTPPPATGRSYTDVAMQLPPPPLPPGPYPETARTLYEQDQAWIRGAAPPPGAKKDETLLWLAVGYLYMRGRKKAA